MKKNRMKKSRGGKKIGRWATKAKKQQRGGFVSLIVAGLISIGMSASAAATIASVASPVVSGVVSASAGYAATKALKKVGGSKHRRRRAPSRRLHYRRR